MTEPLFNIEVFNQKTTQDKIDYLNTCIMSIPEKSFHESPFQYENRIKEFMSKTDYDYNSKEMCYMLELMKKYKPDEDCLIIKDYEDYVETKKSSL